MDEKREKALRMLATIGTHIACYEPKYEAYMELLGELDWEKHLATFEARRAAMKMDSQDAPMTLQCTTEGNVACICGEGPISKKPTSMSDLFGGISTIELQKAVSDAGKNKAIKSIAVNMESPGGTVDGVDSCANAIWEVAQEKPVVFYFSDMGASAAYWLGSGATKIFANKTSLVGNIGTVTSIDDTSGMLQQRGVIRNKITNKDGKYKGIGMNGVPVTASDKEEMQRVVDSVHQPFAEAVARGRGMSLKQAYEMSDGRIYVAQDAQDKGLIDGIASFEEVLSAMQAGDFEFKSLQVSAANTESGKSKEKTKMEDEEKKVEMEQNASFLSNLRNALGFGGSNHNASGNSQYQATAQIPMVTATLAVHPLVSACQAAGINSAEDLGKLQARSVLADELEAEFRAETEKLCIMAYGQDGAEAFLSAVKDTNVPLSAVRNIRKSADAAYDKAFPSASTRQTEAGDPNAQGNADVPVKGNLESSIDAAVKDIGEQSSAIPAFLKNGANVKVGK